MLCLALMFFLFLAPSLIYSQKTVSGTITGDGEALIGANVLVKDTNIGTVTDVDGAFTLENVPDASDILVVSFLGYETQEVSIAGRTVVDINLQVGSALLDELVVVGYGTQKKSDLTGAVVRADIETFREQPNISLFQSLQGTVPGLNIGQVDAAGEDPTIRIRERTSLGGEQQPLIVLDGVIYRGNLVDLNPNDISAVDILKDASSTAIYGSQAANGVILITSKTGKTVGKTSINYQASYTMQDPTKEFRAQGVEGWYDQYVNGFFFDSRFAPDFTELDPDYDARALFKTQDMVTAYDAYVQGSGPEAGWYDLLTDNNPSIQSHNLSLTHHNENVSSFMSVGYTDQIGYHVGEDYTRWNARLNLDNYVTDWLTIGVQSFATSSDFSGLDINRELRYLPPVALPRDENGELTVQPGGLSTNPLRDLVDADHTETRLNLFGNIYAKIDLPFIEGLSYKINYSTNYRSDFEAIFRPHGSTFQGEGSKLQQTRRSWTSDNILNYQRTFGVHSIDATAVYGFEERTGIATGITANGFVSDVLGFNRLGIGSNLSFPVDGGNPNTSADDGEYRYEEASLYSLGRLSYGYDGKYLVTGTVRRDGFSGFSENEKFGIFPSASVAWVVSKESFFKSSLFSSLKLRGSYGSSGNRTLGRYDTQARLAGQFGYIDANGNSLFTQSITQLASPELRWETTTGYNIGVDFSMLDYRITGSIDYYKNDTKDILFDVPIPRIARFSQVSTNLGKLANNGIDLTVSSVNIRNDDWDWTSSVTFSRSRHELRELLGFDNDGDGKEDDIIGAGLFIGEPIGTIYDFEVDGIYQVGEEIPAGLSIGGFRLVDKDGVAGFTPNDRTILGYEDPSYRFSILNKVQYKNWSLKVFINSVQGGSDRYLGRDNLLSWNVINGDSQFDRVLFEGADFWHPGNPDGRYQGFKVFVADGLRGTYYVSRSFVRLQDVSLGYTFDQAVLDKTGLSGLRLFVSAKNLATWTDWPGWDPETGTGLTRSGRPVMRSVTFGLNVSL